MEFQDQSEIREIPVFSGHKSFLHTRGFRTVLLPGALQAAWSHICTPLCSCKCPSTQDAPIASLQQGFPKFPPRLLGSLLNAGVPTLSRKRDIWAFYLGELLSQAPGHFPLLLIVKFIAQQQDRNSVSHSFLQNRSFPPLREASLDEAREWAHGATWKEPGSCESEPSNGE